MLIASRIGTPALISVPERAREAGDGGLADRMPPRIGILSLIDVDRVLAALADADQLDQTSMMTIGRASTYAQP